MTATAHPIHSAAAPLAPAFPATAAQALILAAMAAGLAAGYLATPDAATAHAITIQGTDFTRLMRAMAAIKSIMALGAGAATVWRLATPAGPARLAAYALAGAAMAAGPGLIWGMVHIGAGALLLHGGLLAAILLLWRDPAVAVRLAAIIQARREKAVLPYGEGGGPLTTCAKSPGRKSALNAA